MLESSQRHQGFYIQPYFPHKNSPKIEIRLEIGQCQAKVVALMRAKGASPESAAHNIVKSSKLTLCDKINIVYSFKSILNSTDGEKLSMASLFFIQLVTNFFLRLLRINELQHFNSPTQTGAQTTALLCPWLSALVATRFINTTRSTY